MQTAVDTLMVRKPLRFGGKAYKRGQRFSADMENPVTARKVHGLKRRGYLDIWTRERRKEDASVTG
ncbi:MAG: hypothetical protein GY937_22830 [bacterium]|nr:hypothetical protein [bacterium]